MHTTVLSKTQTLEDNSNRSESVHLKYKIRPRSADKFSPAASVHLPHRPQRVVLDRLTRYKRLEQYPEDKELLGDVIVENQQAIEMTSIYRDIINGTRELLSSVIDNRMNSIMKSLTVITLVMAIPTVISGIYGMNVNEHWVPFANTAHGFAIIIGIMVIICVIILLLLRKKRIL